LIYLLPDGVPYLFRFILLVYLTCLGTSPTFPDTLPCLFRYFLMLCLGVLFYWLIGFGISWGGDAGHFSGALYFLTIGTYSTCTHGLSQRGMNFPED
jgi:hypothetical protein